MVEFALVLVPLLVLVLGAVSFGVLLSTKHALEEAAGEAARAAAVTWDDPGTPDDERVEVAVAALDSSSIVDGRCSSAGDALTCTTSVAPCSGDPDAACLTVDVVHDRDVDPIVGRMPLIDALMPDTLEARATVVVDDG